MKLYTKRGDDGSTSLFGGRRVPKDNLRIAACGAVDEVNAAIGMAVAVCQDDDTNEALKAIQADLFVLGAELATQTGSRPPAAIQTDDVTRLERWIDQAAAETPPLANFILPQGSELAVRLHLARTVCRRAEREAVTLANLESISARVLAYLNRLGDLLFALARRANQRAGMADIPWTAPDPARAGPS